MADESPRELVHELLQKHLIQHNDMQVENGLLLGWIVVAECMDSKGERWLSTICGDAQGEQPPTWQVEGYLHHRLYGWAKEDE